MIENDSKSVGLDCIPAVSPMFRLQFEPVQDTWVLLYPEGMVKLNPSAAEILNRCDGQRSVKSIVADLEKACEQSGLADDVINFLRTALEQQWITLSRFQKQQAQE
jgi:pyrroloquinoline quinone biosynthesis protein D